jgi:hypothetical protein
VHVGNIEALRRLCKEICDSKEEYRVEASVTVSEPKQALRRQKKGQVTNVCLAGPADMVNQMRGLILRKTPVALVYFPESFRPVVVGC